MAHGEQVRDAGPGALDVVDGDQVGAEVGRRAVDGDDVQRRRQHLAVGVAGGVDRHEDDAGDALGAQRLEDVALARRVLVGVGEQQRVAGRLQHQLDAADHGGEERVLQVGDDHADRLAGADPQRPGGAARPVVERARGVLDAQAQLSLTAGGSAITRDTVAIETPARSATRLMVAPGGPADVGSDRARFVALVTPSMLLRRAIGAARPEKA